MTCVPVVDGVGMRFELNSIVVQFLVSKINNKIYYFRLSTNIVRIGNLITTPYVAFIECVWIKIKKGEKKITKNQERRAVLQRGLDA